jgi:hypothetical protein
VKPRPVIAACAALAAAACGRDSSPTAPQATPQGSDVTLSVVSGNSQSGPVNTQLPQPIRVRITDSNGNPVPNFVVNFVATSGGGSVFGEAEETNSSGYVDELWTLGPRLGAQTLAAQSVNSSTGAGVTYGTFTATATPPANVVVVAQNGSGLIMMNANGSGLKQLTTNSADAMPNLSPDHSMVAFVSGASVYVMNVNGTNRHIVSSSVCSPSAPHFSPDGNLIVYTAPVPDPTCDTDTWGLQIVNAAANVIDSWDQPATVTGASAWSADGQHYYFASSELSDGENLYESSPVPSFPDAFVSNTWETAQEVTHGMDVEVSAASPDGQHVAFVGAPMGTSTTYAYIMGTDGSNLKQITTALGLGGVLSYSPDGTLIAIDHGFMNLDGTGYTVVKGCPCSFGWR